MATLLGFTFWLSQSGAELERNLLYDQAEALPGISIRISS